MKIIRRGKTTHYDMFKMSKGNRDYSEFHAAEILSIIKEKNMLEAYPILCEKTADGLLVYDGQHRLAAAKKLGIPIFYQIADHLTPADISRLNRNQKGWRTKDYLKHHADTGKKDYQTLMGFVEETGIPISLSVQILSSSNIHEGGLNANFKRGEFRVGKIDKALELVDIMDRIKSAGCRFTRDRSLVKALSAIHSTGVFNVERLLPRLKYMPLEKAASWRQYVKDIDYRYNYRVPGKDKVALAFEAINNCTR